MDQGAIGRSQRRPKARAASALSAPTVHLLQEEVESEAGDFDVIEVHPEFHSRVPTPPPVIAWPAIQPGTAVLLFWAPTDLVCECTVCRHRPITLGTQPHPRGIHLNRATAEGPEPVWECIRHFVRASSPSVVLVPASQAYDHFRWNAFRHRDPPHVDAAFSSYPHIHIW